MIAAHAFECMERIIPIPPSMTMIHQSRTTPHGEEHGWMEMACFVPLCVHIHMAVWHSQGSPATTLSYTIVMTNSDEISADAVQCNVGSASI
jgi:hypothetical protein